MTCDICGDSVKKSRPNEKVVGVRMCPSCFDQDTRAMERRRRVGRPAEGFASLVPVLASGRLAQGGRMGAVVVRRG